APFKADAVEKTAASEIPQSEAKPEASASPVVQEASAELSPVPTTPAVQEKKANKPKPSVSAKQAVPTQPTVDDLQANTPTKKPAQVEARKTSRKVAESKVQKSESGPLLFSRAEVTEQGTKGSDAARLRKQFAPLIARWRNAPQITIVQSVTDLPVRYLDKLRSQNAEGDVEGFFDQKANAVYLVADRLADTPRALHVLVHEVLGHAGLRGLFGKQLNPLLASLYREHANVREAAD
ncbi:hypothetical protein, partial [Chitinimonas sp. BJB300]